MLASNLNCKKRIPISTCQLEMLFIGPPLAGCRRSSPLGVCKPTSPRRMILMNASVGYGSAIPRVGSAVGPHAAIKEIVREPRV